MRGRKPEHEEEYVDHTSEARDEAQDKHYKDMVASHDEDIKKLKEELQELRETLKGLKFLETIGQQAAKPVVPPVIAITPSVQIADQDKRLVDTKIREVLHEAKEPMYRENIIAALRKKGMFKGLQQLDIIELVNFVLEKDQGLSEDSKGKIKLIEM